MAVVPTPFADGFSPIHFELAPNMYLADTYLDIMFPVKVVIKAILILTPQDKFLQTFTLQTSETDFVTPNDLKDLIFLNQVMVPYN